MARNDSMPRSLARNLLMGSARDVEAGLRGMASDRRKELGKAVREGRLTPGELRAAKKEADFLLGR